MMMRVNKDKAVFTYEHDDDDGDDDDGFILLIYNYITCSVSFLHF